MVPALLVAAAVSCGPGSAPEPRPPEPPPPVLRLEPEVLDLGVLPRGGRARGAVTLRAMPYQGVRIERLEVPCDCTTADLGLPVELEAGAEIDLPVTLDLRDVEHGGGGAPGETGPWAIERRVVAHVAEGPPATLTVRALVSDAVRLEPAQLAWVLEAGETARAEIVARGEGASPPVKAAVPRHDPGATAPPVEIERSDEGGATRLRVSWGPLEPGRHEAEILLLTRSEELERVVVPLEARVVHPVRVTPPAIEVPAADPSRPVVATLTLQRRDGHVVRVTGARSSEHRIRLDVLPPQPHVPEARIRAVVPVLPHPRETTATIEILTDADERPLRVPVRVAARR